MQINNKIIPIEYILHNFRLKFLLSLIYSCFKYWKTYVTLRNFCSSQCKISGVLDLDKLPQRSQSFLSFPSFLPSFSLNLLSFFLLFVISFFWSASSIPSNPGYNYQDYIIFIYFAESQWWRKDAQGVVWSLTNECLHH